MKLSDYVVNFLQKNGVDNVFIVAGGGCMHLVNSLGDSKNIKYVCTHHEQSAAIAAEAYAKQKNDFGVVLVTSGPGATNTITGLLGAYQDSIPCIFISGQAKRYQTVYNSGIPGLRQFGVQEANIIPIVESICKYAVMVNNPQKIRYHLEKAVYIAKSGRPGPVWLDIPLDIQSALVNEKELEGFVTLEHDVLIKKEPNCLELEYVLEKLKNSKRPVIISGHGVRLADACKVLQNFVEEYKIPVVTPIMGIDTIETNHFCNIGRVGTKGTRAGNFAMQNADLIISIGSRLAVSVVGHEYELFAREASIIVVDIDDIEHMKKTIEIDKIILSDAKVFLEKISESSKKCCLGNYGEWLSICNNWKVKYPVILKEYDNDSNGINYYKFVSELSEKTSPEMTIISDAGSAFYVVSQAVVLKENQRYITSGAIASMGFSLPAAIGVSVAQDNKYSVLAITGDGSFQQNIQELEVMKFHNMPIKLFVMNNGGYFSIMSTQNKFFDGNLVGESEMSGISFPKTKKIAEAYGIDYVCIEKLAGIGAKIEEILYSDKPMVIEVILDKTSETIPTNASQLREDGVMISKPLEDMYPFLPRKEFFENMIVKPIEE